MDLGFLPNRKEFRLRLSPLLLLMFIVTLFGVTGCERPEPKPKGKRVVFTGTDSVAGSKTVPDPKDLLPEAVLATLKKRFPDAKIEAFETGEENRQEVFEIQLSQNDLRIDVTITPAGVLMWIENQIAFESMPTPVRETVQRRHKGEILHSEEVIKVTNGKEVLDHYDILLETPDGKWFGVEVFPNGRIKGTEDRTSWKEKE